MKKGIGILSIMLVCIMALSLAACGEKQQTMKSVDNSDEVKLAAQQESEKEARAIAEEFMEKVRELNFKDAKSYVTAESGLEDWDGATGRDTIKEYLRSSIGLLPDGTPQNIIDKFDAWCANTSDKMIAMVSYTIDDVKCTEENKAVVKGTLSFKDLGNIGSILAGIDFDGLSKDVMDEFYKSEKVNENSSQEEMLDVYVDIMLPKLEAKILDGLKNTDTKTNEFELVMRKNNEKWSIIAEESTGLNTLGKVSE